MPTDMSRFDWNNTGVHRANRNVRPDRDCGVIAVIQLKWKPGHFLEHMENLYLHRFLLRYDVHRDTTRNPYNQTDTWMRDL